MAEAPNPPAPQKSRSECAAESNFNPIMAVNCFLPYANNYAGVATYNSPKNLIFRQKAQTHPQICKGGANGAPNTFPTRKESFMVVESPQKYGNLAPLVTERSRFPIELETEDIKINIDLTVNEKMSEASMESSLLSRTMIYDAPRMQEKGPEERNPKKPAAQIAAASATTSTHQQAPPKFKPLTSNGAPFISTIHQNNTEDETGSNNTEPEDETGSNNTEPDDETGSNNTKSENETCSNNMGLDGGSSSDQSS